MTMETVTKLVTYTVGAGGVASPITFSNIPQTYTDLKIEISIRGDGTSTPTLNLSSVNGSTSNISTKLYEFYQGIGSGFSGGKTLTTLAPIVYTSTSHTAGTFGIATIYVSNYSSNLIKNFYTEYSMESMDNSDYVWNGIFSGVWSQTVPVNSLTFTTNRTIQQHSTFTIYGITSKRRVIPSAKPIVTGGTLSSDSQFFYRTFTSSGTLSISGAEITADVLVIAGGGAGGASNSSGYYGGGGGAGGLMNINATKLFGNNPVVIGAGGAYPGNNRRGIAGTNSSLGFIIANGGGGGGGGSDSSTFIVSEKDGGVGGSGGGGQSAVGTGGLGGGVGGSPVSGQGFAGGNGAGVFQVEPQAGGGGGGAGGAGANATSAAVGGAGGVGSSAYSAWGLATGTGQLSSGIYYYAGGGGGASNGTGGAAGLGGGGAGGGSNGANGTANTGGGAGNGMVGGSGIVIVRYTKSQVV